MNAKDIIETYLKNNGYDGLCTDDCGCLIDDLAPCGEDMSFCEPGYKHYDCKCGETDCTRWGVRNQKPEVKP